jgi:regulator of sirC expression with transglutaminase-like and TPR domain
VGHLNGVKELRETDRVALLKLLSDDDPRVQTLLREKFEEFSDRGAAFLEWAAQQDEPIAQRIAQEMLWHLRERVACEKFLQFCRESSAHFDLEGACWLLAATRYPDLNAAAYEERLNQMARELRPRIANAPFPRVVIENINQYLYRELGFRGNQQDYYDPDNSFLNRVLDRRLGIPISLSAVYLFLGKRLGLPLVGIGLPGHFIIQWRAGSARVFIDPFNEGVIRSEEQCAEIIAHSGREFRPSMLEPITARQILARMCANLAAIYRDIDPPRANWMESFLAALRR